jgi:uridine kinase
MRIVEPSMTLQLGKNEIVIFEGIHALNSMITDHRPEAFKLYISARMNIELQGEVYFKGTWIRLLRRIVRDRLFRGTSVEKTLGMWENVRKGEKLYISPFKDKANYQFDSALPYEVSVMKESAADLIHVVKEGTPRYDEILQIFAHFDGFKTIVPSHVPSTSLLREFIGGSSYYGM